MPLPNEAVELSPAELSFPLRGQDLGRVFEVTGTELNAVHLQGQRSCAARVAVTVGGIVAGCALVVWLAERGGR